MSQRFTTSSAIRAAFLDFFAGKDHTVVPSSSLVPAEDPTLLLTNARMVRVHDPIMGRDSLPYRRAVSSHRCVRAGGKHHDLETVGYSARHHTFFEMLGNFSFGDYFKREAIRYAWEFLTSPQWLGLPPERLWITVYDEDEEALGYWRDEVGVPEERIVRIGDNLGGRYASDNFWSMGDTGPCGPSTEIFYDHGPGVAGGPPGSPEEDGDRYIEIWNCVFMQYNRGEDGSMEPLPAPSVDTGMGLERISAVMQGVHSNYQIDLMQALVKAAARETGTEGLDNPSLNVLADHIRACAFLVVDGVIPGNEGRGYVLRRIIRRAIRHGYKLGARSAFFHRLVPDLVAEMGSAYPELAEARSRVVEVLRQEEKRFFETIANGMDLLERALAELVRSGETRLDGETAFRLHDTYGFPLDLTADVCRERGLEVDEDGFDAAMARQREQARAAGRFRADAALDYQAGVTTDFLGHDQLVVEDATVVALYVEGAAVETMEAGQQGVVVLDRTPFYAEAGGQVGDSGELCADGLRFVVDDTQKIQAEVFGHHGCLKEGSLRVGAPLSAKVDGEQRQRIVRNHSATHLLHRALRDVLGDHVQQKGSLVDAERTRFDFVHGAALSSDELRRIEGQVNAEILANRPPRARLLPLDEARQSGALMLFGEKYGDEVRVLDIGSSRELCGGTHVERTGDIGVFRIVGESGVAAGVRRIEAVTGTVALAWMQARDEVLSELAALLRSTPEQLAGRVEGQQQRLRELERELERLKQRLATGAGGDLSSQAIEVAGVRVLASQVDGADARSLRTAMDQLKDKLGSAGILLADADGERISLVAGVTRELTDRFRAGDLMRDVAPRVGGKGGGRPDLAQGGGSDVAALPAALKRVADWVAEQAG